MKKPKSNLQTAGCSIALRLEEAAIWASTGSALAFAWEIAKANMLDSPPDIGVRNTVRFAK